jgi:hypothetical protein
MNEILRRVLRIHSSQCVGCNDNLHLIMVENDTGVEGDDGNDSDESMWSLPVRTTTALCVCVRAYRVRV